LPWPCSSFRPNILWASLYQAKKISFGVAAELAGLRLGEFNYRLQEHFGHGLVIDEETAREDLRVGVPLAETAHQLRSPASVPALG
jgi:hypothetical protein